MRILLVEDEVLIAMEQRWYLENEGHEVCGPCATAAQALALALEQPPQLALVDLHLSQNSSGIDAARGLSAMGVPCLFVTSYGEEVRENRAFGLGCLAKPFSEASLIGAVRAVQARLAGRTPEHVPKTLELFE